MGSISYTKPSSRWNNYYRPSASEAAADTIPILIDDTYHVFHLTTPHHTKHHPERLRSSWSRIQSRDLVTWTRDRQPVIEPSPDSQDADADGVWTGAAVLGPEDNMVIFYTGYNLSQNGKQVILRTPAPDRHGSRFEKRGQEIIIKGTGLGNFEDIDFRDPYVFYNDEESTYWMLVATRLRKGPHWSRGCIALLTSSDLAEWTVNPEPLYSPNDMFCPECPELFRLPNGKWYLAYSRFHGPNAGTVYRISDHPRGPFRIPRDGSQGRLDGRRWYAAKSCPKAGDPSRRIYFGWTGDYVDDEGKWLWGGDCALPRQVYADEHGHLKMQLAPECEKDILSGPSTEAHIELKCEGSTGTQFLTGMVSESFAVEIHFDSVNACSFGLVLDADESEKGHRIQLTPTAGGLHSVSLLTDFPPLDDFWADQYNLHLPRSVDGPELIRHEGVEVQSSGGILLVTGQVVEFFCGGRCLTYRLPMSSEAGHKSLTRLGCYVQDGQVAMHLKVHTL